MEWKELKKKNQADLQKLLAEQRDKLRDLRFKDANKQLKNVREIRQTRRLVARVLTLLGEFRSGKSPAAEAKTAGKPSEQ